MPEKHKRPFNTHAYLGNTGPGRSTVNLRAKQLLSAQGDVAESMFYLQAGRAKLTVISKSGKEATVTLLAAGDFFGEECLEGINAHRTTSATAITACKVLKIQGTEMARVLHEENAFSDLFVQYMAHRGARTQADLIDQLFNNSERRLARTLLLMADFGKSSMPETLIPSITQETLADLIGTTRSRVSYFMNRFRKLGYINYKGRIRVHKSLLNVVLHDRLPEQNASRPTLLDPRPSRALTTKRTKFVGAQDYSRQIAS